MIEKLEQLTIGKFVDLVCGDTGVLREKHESISDKVLLITMRNILFEYKEIADPSGVRTHLLEVEELIKAKIEVIIFSICGNLVGLKEYSRAREVLTAYGIHTERMNDSRIEAEIRSRLERAKRTIDKIEGDTKSETTESSKIRREFDAQTAAMTAHFKFQIDTSTMKATVYAHLVARHNSEIKAQLAALKGKKH